MYYKIILFNIIQIIGQARKALIYSNLTTNVYWLSTSYTKIIGLKLLTRARIHARGRIEAAKIWAVK